MNQHRVIEVPRPEQREIADEEIAFTAADFFYMLECGAFEDMRVELAGGRLIKMMPADFGHGSTGLGVGAKLYGCFDNPGARLASDLAVKLDNLTVLAPDVALLRDKFAGQKPVEAAHILLAVEISDSSLARDLREKQRDYARAGIPHYWVVDVNKRVAHVFGAPGEDGYRDHFEVPFGEPLAVPGTDKTITLD